MSAPLDVGQEAGLLLYGRRTPAGAAALLGAARARVEEIEGDSYRVRLVAVSLHGDMHPGPRVGDVLRASRKALYAHGDPGDHAAFVREVRRFWEPAWRGQGGR